MRGEGVGEEAEAGAGLDGRAVGAARRAARVVQPRHQRLRRRPAARDAPRRRRAAGDQQRPGRGQPQERLHGEAPATHVGEK